MYISRRSGADNPKGQNCDVNKMSCYFGNLLQIWIKNLFEVWFHTFFFMILCMYIAPGPALTSLWDETLMSTRTSCHFGHLLQVLKNLWSLILCNFFMILYMFIARGRGRQPPGDKILKSTDRHRYYTHLLLVQRNLILYNLFSWFNTCI